jgi:hypothetical protein
MQEKASWEQQPGEQAQSYEAALVYFKLGPQRTLKEVAALYGKSPSTIARWSKRDNWRERAQAFDAHRLKMQDVERRKVLEEAARTEAQTWFERLRLEREEEWETSRALLAKARQMLASPLEDTKWNWRDAGVLIDQAAKLVRLAAGESDEAQDESGTQRELTIRVEYADEPAARGADETDEAEEV